MAIMTFGYQFPGTGVSVECDDACWNDGECHPARWRICLRLIASADRLNEPTPIMDFNAVSTSDSPPVNDHTRL
jgi:hypothetical protein